jgi:uncharacterized protein (DUF2252 family)
VDGRAAKAVLSALSGYRQGLSPDRRHIFDLFRQIDVGFVIVGTWSVGLRNFIVLLEGNGPNEPVFLQLKQEEPSAYARYLPTIYRNQGQRVADGQLAIQPISDLVLGWTTIGEQHYMVRQLNDRKGSIDLKTLSGDGLTRLALVAGVILAHAHARIWRSLHDLWLHRERGKGGGGDPRLCSAVCRPSRSRPCQVFEGYQAEEDSNLT